MMDRISNKIFNARVGRGLSQKTLADLVGLDVKTIIAMESQTRWVLIQNVITVAEYLGLQLEMHENPVHGN